MNFFPFFLFLIEEVAFPDNRLTELAQLSESKSIIPTKMSFVDIAGLVKGASKGEGLRDYSTVV